MAHRWVARAAAAGGVLVLAVLPALTVAEWVQFDGTCRTMGFPFLAAPASRDCSFLEYLSSDPRSFLWLVPPREAVGFLVLAAGLAAVVGVVCMLIYRRRLLRSEGCPGRSEKVNNFLEGARLDGLKGWERRMVRSFAGIMMATFLLVGFDLVFDLNETVVLFLLLPLLAAVGWAVRLQFSARCPLCDYPLGLQTRLLLPDSCECCGVPLREKPAAGGDSDRHRV